MKKSILIITVIVVAVASLWFLLPATKNPETKPKINVKVSKSESNNKLVVPEHIVVVIEENHSLEQIEGNKKAPYMNSLFEKGALMTNSHGVKHPSQPNYIALFSGDTQGVTSDHCPQTFSADNLATQLEQAGKSFAGYSEDLPKVGFTGCASGAYARKHNPWVDFTIVASKVNLPFTSFPKDFSKLPTVSFVIPNLNDDIHDGTIEQADAWLSDNLDSYVQWANDHNSLFILTWDEDDFRPANHIPTLFLGPMVKPGKYGGYIDHYNVLRTIQAMYNLGPLSKSGHASIIDNIWE